MPVEISLLECLACEEGLAHCHAAAIVHLDGWLQCSEDPGCELPGEAHLHVLACTELEGCCR